jgi:hypothetical protein
MYSIVYHNSIHGSQYTITLELNDLLVGRQSNGINTEKSLLSDSHTGKKLNEKYQNIKYN